MITDLIFLLPNNGTYTRDSRILRSKLTGPRIFPSPPANAPEPQAPSRPPLRSTSHKISPTSGLNQMDFPPSPLLHPPPPPPLFPHCRSSACSSRSLSPPPPPPLYFLTAAAVLAPAGASPPPSPSQQPPRHHGNPPPAVSSLPQ